MSTATVWTSGGPLRAPRRQGSEAWELLFTAASPPTVELYPSLPIGAASQALPALAVAGSRLAVAPLALQDPAWQWSRRCARSCRVCLDLPPLRLQAKPAADPRALELDAPELSPRPLSQRGAVPGEPRWSLLAIFEEMGLEGVRLHLDPIPEAWHTAGLDSGSLLHAGSALLAAAVAGLPLSLPQIYLYTIHLAQLRGAPQLMAPAATGFSPRGAPSVLAAFHGGVMDAIYLPQTLGGGAAVCRALVPEERFDELAAHLALIEPAEPPTDELRRAQEESWACAGRTTRAAAHLDDAVAIGHRITEALRTADWPRLVAALEDDAELQVQLGGAVSEPGSDLTKLCRQRGIALLPLEPPYSACLAAAEDPDALDDLSYHLAAGVGGPTLRRLRARRKGFEIQHWGELGLKPPGDPLSLSTP